MHYSFSATYSYFNLKLININLIYFYYTTARKFPFLYFVVEIFASKTKHVDWLLSTSEFSVFIFKLQKTSKGNGFTNQNIQKFNK